MIKKFFGNMNKNKKDALLLILLFGVISLLGDIIYEGARSVNGPYLNTLGASAAIVGLIVGIGEFLGYAIRLFSGYFSDKTKAHWIFTIAGYSLLMAVPLLALANAWQFAAIFIILERIGKGLRSPAKDTLLSHATKQVGTGIGFGIAEFLDQIGATIGPLIFTFMFMAVGTASKVTSDYQQVYSYMWLPFVMLMFVLFFAYFKVKSPEKLEDSQNANNDNEIPKIFWKYSLFTFFTTIGFISFAIVGYHLSVHKIISDTQIPFFYAIAMIIDAIFGLIVGRLYDKLKQKNNNENSGLLILVAIPILTALMLPMIFSYSLTLLLLGVFLWGVIMGMHETVMKASIADIIPIKKRGTAYGIFNLAYGLSMFIGSTLAGYLYEISIPLMITIMVLIEMFSLILFFNMKKQIRLQ